MNSMGEDQTVTRAWQSGGYSGGQAFYEFVIRGQEKTLVAGGVLDLGCGTGDFGRFLQHRFGITPCGTDLVRFPTFAEASYERFIIADLDSLQENTLPGGWRAIFAIGILEYLTNPRAFVQAASRLLAPKGCLTVTSPNPFSLKSLFTALRAGEFSAFREATNPASITPVAATAAARMLREAGLENVATKYSGRGSIPGSSGVAWQRIIPAAGGRWFSDDFRITGVHRS